MKKLRSKKVITVVVKPNVKHFKITSSNGNEFVIAVPESAKNDQANKAVIRAVADHFSYPASLVYIKQGRNRRQKLICLG